MGALYFPLKNDTSRKIIHLDMDAFFASVEERDCPALAKVPLVIARHPNETQGRGVVTTANYLARQYGIHSAMSAQKAYELCPHAIFVAGNHQKYRDISQRIRAIMHRYTDVIEPISIDEAYLDVTENKLGIRSAMKIAKMLQHDIWTELGLTSSAGISYNKFLAKVASDYEKPRGLTVITPAEATTFLAQLPIEKFHGIGRKTIPQMHELGIFTGADLAQLDEFTLIQHFGKMGYSLYRKVRGIHESPVNTQRIRKSIGKEHTYEKALIGEDEVLLALSQLAEEVAVVLHKEQKHGKTLVLKIRDQQYQTVTKRVTLPTYLDQAIDLFRQARIVLDNLLPLKQPIRLLGLTVTNLDPRTYENITLPLWEK